MTLRAKLLLYLVVLHLVLAALAAWILINQPLLLFVVEAVFIASVLTGNRLLRELFVPLELIRTGGELIAERDFTSTFVPVGQPEMDALIRVYNAMIERLRDERLAARERHELLSRMVDASPAGIVVCDFDGRFERVNPAARALLSPAIEEMMRSIAPGESRMVPEAAPRRLRISRSEFRDRGFPKTFYMLEELTEELRLSEKAAYEKLIRMMSHEVNNSVGAVRSLLESCMRYADQVSERDRDDFRNALEVASARVESLNRFMRGFADVVRIPAPHRTVTAVADAVRAVAALLKPETDARRIAVTVDVDETTASLDINQFEQVAINIVKNAVDAVDQDGSIAIRLSNGVLTVDDSGAGVPRELAGELFTPFFTTRREGRGLGLTIVQEILMNHGFAFSLANRPGGGARFRIDMRQRES